MNETEKAEKADYRRKQVSRYRAVGLTMKAWCTSDQFSFGKMKCWIRKPGLHQGPNKA